MYILPGEKRGRIKREVTLINLFTRLFWPVKLIIFPSRCQLCSELLENPGEKVVCGRCLSRMEVHRGEVCQICGRFFYHQSGQKSICLECEHNPPIFSYHRSLGLYSGNLKDLIILFKYKGFEILSQPLAAALYKKYQKEGIFSGINYILPVPLHRQKQKARGFNQAELLAEELSRLSGLPWSKKILVKIKNTPAQVSLEASEREKNLQGAFAVKQPDKVKGKAFLLIDDVFTTGSTIRECARVLSQSGAREVRALTIARA